MLWQAAALRSAGVPTRWALAIAGVLTIAVLIIVARTRNPALALAL
jgi:hypothetical protein